MDCIDNFRIMEADVAKVFGHYIDLCFITHTHTHTHTIFLFQEKII